jgi:ribosomal protein L37AE/L43A
MQTKTFCGGCGADVTTGNANGIYPCSRCGSTFRVSGTGLLTVMPSGQPIFSTHTFTR